jgi:hypothetical protein
MLLIFRRELDLGVNAVLETGGANMHHTVKKPFANQEYGEGSDQIPLK